MSFDQSRIDRIKQDPDSKYNKYLRREIQLDVLENEDLPVPYEHSDFISQYEYESYNYKSDLKNVSNIVSQAEPIKRLYYNDFLENFSVTASLKESDNLINILRKHVPYEDNTTIKNDWHTGNKTVYYSDYLSHQNLIGYKDTMVEKLKVNNGILIFPQGYKTFSQDSFKEIGDGSILKSLKITDGIEALRESSVFENNYELSDLYTSITLEGNVSPYNGFKNTKVKDIFILSDNIQVPQIYTIFYKTIDSIVIYDMSDLYDQSFFEELESSRNIKKVCIIKTENSDGKRLERVENAFLGTGIEVQSVSEQEAFEIMGYDYNLYLKKKKDGIPEYDWGDLKPEQYNPSITTIKEVDSLMSEISFLEKNTDEVLEKDKDAIKNSYEFVINGYKDAIEKLQTVEDYDLNAIDNSGNILKYIEYLKGRINTKLRVLQANNETVDNLHERIEALEANKIQLEKDKQDLQSQIDAYTNIDKNLIIQDSLNIFKTFIGVHKDDTEEDEFYIFCLSTAYERLQKIDGIKLYSDDISKHLLVLEAQRVLTQSTEETLYEKGLKLTRYYATRGGKDE